MLRELAWIEVETEPPPGDDVDTVMSDEQFDAELALAAAGDWAALGLDSPEDLAAHGWEPATIEDLMNDDA